MPLQAPLKKKKKAFVQIQYCLKVLFLHIALHFLKQRNALLSYISSKIMWDIWSGGKNIYDKLPKAILEKKTELVG